MGTDNENKENILKSEKTQKIKNDSKNEIQKETKESKVNIAKGKKEESESITMRQALRDTMAEEMRKDKNIFVIGEEVAEYQGAYKVTQDLLKEFGKKRDVILLCRQSETKPLNKTLSVLVDA